MLLAMIWKEAHEHFWKFFALLVILLGTMSFTECPLITEHIRGGWLVTWMAVAWLSPLWLAAYTITYEHTRRTNISLLALPVSRLLIFTAKTLFALVTFMLPLIFCLAVGHGSIRKEEELACEQILFGLPALYFFILCIALNIRREGLAAMVGILVLLFCMICGIFVEEKFGRPIYEGSNYGLAHPILFEVLIIPNPLSRLMVGTSPNFGPHWLESSLSQQLAVIVGYGVIAALRYAFLPPFSSRKTPPSSSAKISTLSNLSLSSRRYPIIWKECREQFPIILLTAVVGMVLALFFAYIDYAGAGYRPHPSLTYLRDTLQIFFIMGNYLAFAVATILGLGSITSDMHSPVTAYWRATTIPARRLFWTKVLVSLFGVLLLYTAFEVPYFIGDPILEARGIISRNSFGYSVFNAMVGHAVMLPLTLSLAILFATLIRRSIYAAAATFLAIAVIFVLPLNDRFATIGSVLYDRDGPLSPLYPVVIVILLTGIAVCVFLGRHFFSRSPATLST